MRISPINTIKNIYFQQKVQSNPIAFKQGFDIFTHETKSPEIDLPYRVLRKRKFEISDYKSLKPQQIDKTKANLPTKIKKAVNENMFTGELLKNYFDEIYGEDKYIFACIGTSPAGIGRFMEFSGVETKYFPISSFRGSSDYNRERLERFPKETEKYISFLKNNGITPEEIEKSDKTILFTDYTSTGDTLKSFEVIVREKTGIGDTNKIKFVSLNDELAKADSHFNLPPKKSLRINDYINQYLTCGDIFLYGGIPHLQIFDFKDVNKIIKKRTSEAAKLFNFGIIDKLNKQGKLKENPLNKNSL